MGSGGKDVACNNLIILKQYAGSMVQSVAGKESQFEICIYFSPASQQSH